VDGARVETAFSSSSKTRASLINGGLLLLLLFGFRLEAVIALRLDLGLSDWILSFLPDVAAVVFVELSLILIAAGTPPRAAAAWRFAFTPVHVLLYAIALVEQQFFLHTGTHVDLDLIAYAFANLGNLHGPLRGGIDLGLIPRTAAAGLCFGLGWGETRSANAEPFAFSTALAGLALIGSLGIVAATPEPDGAAASLSNGVFADFFELGAGGYDASSPIPTANEKPRRPPGEYDPLLLRHRAVSHALGGIDGVDYSNSLQALERSLSVGFRLIEVDLVESAESGELICFHEGSEELLTHSEDTGKSRALFAGRFEVITFYELMNIMAQFDDIYLILDTKQGFGRIVERALETAAQVSPGLADRLIPQLYGPADYATAMALHPFAHLIFTLYKVPQMEESDIVQFVSENSIDAVTMPSHRFNGAFVAALRAVGALTYVHTINEPAEIEHILGDGGHGIYTDFDTSLLSDASGTD
jgi:glycerophosphoryl diester phosphodiesterase